MLPYQLLLGGKILMKFSVIMLSGKRLIFGVLTLVCMIAIFCFSMDNADRSSRKSGSVTETIVEIVVNDYKELPAEKQFSILDKAEHIVRKSAHFLIYTLLGFMASCTVGRRKLLSKGSLGALIFSFIYACSDEIHQYFVPGRACMFTDVLIDTSGAAVGITISVVCMFIVGKLADKRSRNE